jgi:cysteine-rich repeat protein
LLAAAGVLKGRSCSAYPAVGPDVSLCGGTFAEVPIDGAHTDGNLVTEACPYGQSSCAVCGATCQTVAGATSYCGDGKLDAAGGEQCDDGNLTPGDGCDATCHGESGGGGACFRIQSERTDRWLTVDGAGKVAATAAAPANGELFELIASGAQFKVKGASGAYLAVAADQLTMNATLATAEPFTRHDCGVYGGRNRYGFESSTGTARNWKEDTAGAPIRSGSGGNGGICNPADAGAWEAFYLEPAGCPGGAQP